MSSGACRPATESCYCAARTVGDWGKRTVKDCAPLLGVLALTLIRQDAWRFRSLRGAVL